jgi:hypothetical protein
MSRLSVYSFIKLSKVLFIIHPLVIGYMTFNYCDMHPIYCFGFNVYNILSYLPIFLAILFSFISLIILKKRKLLKKDLVKKMFLWFLFSIIAAFLLSMTFVSLCADRGKAYDARKNNILAMIYEKQEEFYENNSRYALTLEELFAGENDFIKEDINTFNIIFEGGDDTGTWVAYSLRYIAENEICTKRTNKYFCDKTGCREE